MITATETNVQQTQGLLLTQGVLNPGDLHLTLWKQARMKDREIGV